MKMWHIWFCALAVLRPSAAVSKTQHSTPKNLQQHGHVALLAGDPRYGALHGTGGGMDELNAKEDNGADEKIYRPWETRFDLQPYDLKSADFLKAENRISYRYFRAANPHAALVPNSRDRQAQSTVEMMFGLTALGTIICGVLIVYNMQILDADSLDFQTYQATMLRVIALTAAPWLGLGLWLSTVFLAGVADPMRYPQDIYSWQCNAMAWFLLVAPLINTCYFIVHALWISKLFFSIERQPVAPLGRMFSPSKVKESGDMLTGFLDHATNSTYRFVLFTLEVLCAAFGYVMISFRGGANSHFCQPEVYWATAALVITVVVIILFTSLTFVFSILIGVYSTSPWVQDFFGSFREARLNAKMEKEEENEVQEAAAWKLQRAQEVARFAEDVDYNQEWESMQQEYAEDRQRHEAIMTEHSEYAEAAGQEPPRHPQELEEDKPLVVWDDESVDEAPPATIQPGNWLAESHPGFAMPFGQHPGSAPVLTSSPYVMAGAVMPSTTASTIYTPPLLTEKV